MSTMVERGRLVLRSGMLGGEVDGSVLDCRCVAVALYGSRGCLDVED